MKKKDIFETCKKVWPLGAIALGVCLCRKGGNELIRDLIAKEEKRLEKDDWTDKPKLFE